MPPKNDSRQLATPGHEAGHSLLSEIAVETAVFIVMLLVMFSNIIITNFAFRLSDIDDQVYRQSVYVLGDVYSRVVTNPEYHPYILGPRLDDADAQEIQNQAIQKISFGVLVDSLPNPMANRLTALIRDRIDELLRVVYAINGSCLLEYESELKLRTKDVVDRHTLDDVKKAVTTRCDNLVEDLARQSGRHPDDLLRMTEGCKLAKLAIDTDLIWVGRSNGLDQIPNEDDHAAYVSPSVKFQNQVLSRDQALVDALHIMVGYTKIPPGAKGAFAEWYSVDQIIQQADDGGITMDHQHLNQLRQRVEFLARAMYSNWVERQRSDTSSWAMIMFGIRVMVAYVIALAARWLYSRRREQEEPEPS